MPLPMPRRPSTESLARPGSCGSGVHDDHVGARQAGNAAPATRSRDTTVGATRATRSGSSPTSRARMPPRIKALNRACLGAAVAAAQREQQAPAVRYKQLRDHQLPSASCRCHRRRVADADHGNAGRLAGPRHAVRRYRAVDQRPPATAAAPPGPSPPERTTRIAPPAPAGTAWVQFKRVGVGMRTIAPRARPARPNSAPPVGQPPIRTASRPCRRPVRPRPTSRAASRFRRSSRHAARAGSERRPWDSVRRVRQRTADEHHRGDAHEAEFAQRIGDIDIGRRIRLLSANMAQPGSAAAIWRLAALGMARHMGRRPGKGVH